MKVRVIGAGLSGSEAALQLAKRGFEVELFEMRPKNQQVHIKPKNSPNLSAQTHLAQATRTMQAVNSKKN